MKFVTFKEVNMKENETFIFFLQYDNNEEKLQKLSEIIKIADTSDLYGDFSTFEMDIDTLLSESTVKELENVNLGNFGPIFNVCRGDFTLCMDVFNNVDDLALRLDEFFYAFQITKHFEVNLT
jgi:hypothetical protein